MAAASAALTCATAPQTHFGSVEELKAHYRTDWHRYNLKRKVRARRPQLRQPALSDGRAQVAGLPMVSLDLFERVAHHAALQGSAERAVSTAHLKPDKQRRAGRGARCAPPPPPALRASAHLVRLSSRAAYDSEAEGASSEAEQSDGEWVELEGEEAEAVLMELDGPSASREPAGDASASDDEAEGEAQALSMGAHISLADNGFELKVGNRLLGARELARYYKQRPRPAESAAVIVAAGNTRSVH
jgi:pre-60S factor REI1